MRSMKKRLLFLILCLFTIVSVQPVKAIEEDTKEEEDQKVNEVKDEYGLVSPSAILIQQSGGTIVYEKEALKSFQPNNLTKLMGIYLGCTSNDLTNESTVTMSHEAFQTYDHTSDVLWIEEGETLSLKDLEYSMMLASSNDTTAMLAEAVSGSNEAFVKKMNETAKQIGMEHTEYENVFGIENEKAHTCVKDIATLVVKGLSNQNFYDVFTSRSYNIQPTNKQASQRPFKANVPLMDSSSEYYDESVLGAKVSESSDGTYSVAAYSSSGGLSFVSAVSGASDLNAACNDIRKMNARGFESFQAVKITKEQIGTKKIQLKKFGISYATITFMPDAAFEAVLPSDVSPNLLTSTIEVHGETSEDVDKMNAEVVFKFDEKEIARAALEKHVDQTLPTVFARLFNTRNIVFDIVSLVVLVLFILLRLTMAIRPPEE